MRIDKWLWHARFFRTRTLAAAQVAGGHVRVNSAKIAKPSHSVRPGDTLTFPQGRHIRVIRVEALSDRRGPAPEAQTLYEDVGPKADAVGPRSGGPRPSGRDRRRFDRLSGDALE